MQPYIFACKQFYFHNTSISCFLIKISCYGLKLQDLKNPVSFLDANSVMMSSQTLDLNMKC